MKTYICLFFVFVMSFHSAMAQDISGHYREAKKGLDIYILDNNQTAKLIEAKKAIDKTLADPNYATMAMVWLLSGEIHQKISEQHIDVQLYGKGLKAGSLINPAVVAMKAYKKAAALSRNELETSNGMIGIHEVQYLLLKAGTFALGDNDFRLAYENFNEELTAHKFLTSEGRKSRLSEKVTYLDQILYTAITAFKIQKTNEAKTLFLELYNENYDSVLVYVKLYEIIADEPGSSMASAYKYLEEGRIRYPQDQSLFLPEINYYVRVGATEKAINNLQKFIQLDPEHINAYFTLGNIYDNLYQAETNNGNMGVAAEYFMEAKKAYSSTLEKDPNNFDANYSLGALYYSKAALEINKLHNLGDDRSDEGNRQYDLQYTRVISLMKKALPYFKKTENMDANHVSTLSALKEIYTVLDNLEMSVVFQERLENVQRGGGNASSHFQQ